MRSAPVDIGMTIRSSGSDVLVDEVDAEPVEVSTPTTVTGTPFTSTVWPTGSPRLKSSDAVVAPSTATAEWSCTSWLSMKRPSAKVRPRTVSQDGVVPCTLVVAVSLPALRTSVSEVMAATALMSGASTCEASALASASVNVDAEPSAPRTPVLDVELPAVMVRTLEPSALISEVT